MGRSPTKLLRLPAVSFGLLAALLVALAAVIMAQPALASSPSPPRSPPPPPSPQTDDKEIESGGSKSPSPPSPIKASPPPPPSPPPKSPSPSPSPSPPPKSPPPPPPPPKGGNVSGDPHFVGRHGTRFDFNGLLDRSFCLLSDARLHVNALMEGYRPREGSAGPHKLRTWMREFGFLWRDASGAVHRLRIAARRGPQQQRPSGGSLLAALQLDGRDAPVPRSVGETLKGAGGLQLTLAKQYSYGGRDTDVFNVRIEGVIDAQVATRAAHRLLRTPSDAFVHLDLNVASLESMTPAIHGVLGQTFRDDAERVKRAMTFSRLVQLLQHPIAADGEEGRGFLDGKTEDYVASGVTNADCKFATAWV